MKRFGILPLFLASLLFVAGSIFESALAQSAKIADPHAVQILGFHLGMTIDEVTENAKIHLKQAQITQDISSLLLDSYKTDPITFGTDIKEGDQSLWYSTPNTDYMKFNYSVAANPTVIYISRYRIFDPANAPAVDAFTQSVTDKYGPPTAVLNSGIQHTLVWTWGSTARHTTSYSMSNTLFTNCFTWLLSGFPQNPFNDLRQGNVNFDQDDIKRFYPACGTFLVMQFIAREPDQQLVQSVEFDIGDFHAFVDSYNTAWALLRAGATGAAQAIKKKAAGNSPTL